MASLRPLVRAALLGVTSLSCVTLLFACGGDDDAGSRVPDGGDASAGASTTGGTGGAAGASTEGGTGGASATGGSAGSVATGGLSAGGAGGTALVEDGGLGLDAGDCENRTLFHVDADRDGFGDPNRTFRACALQSGLADNADDCNDASNATYPGAVDSAALPGDQNCDGLEGNAARSIYVIPPPPIVVVDGGLEGGVDASLGTGGAGGGVADAGDGGDASVVAPGTTPEVAFESIQDGIDAAAACAGGPCEVLVAGGTVVEGLVVANGVTVAGGLSADFTGAGEATIVLPPNTLPDGRATVEVRGATEQTLIAGLTIHGPDRSATPTATTGGSSVAVRITASGQANVGVLDSEIVVGIGGKGADGTEGAPGGLPNTCTTHAGGPGGSDGMCENAGLDKGQEGEGPSNADSAAGDGGEGGFGNCLLCTPPTGFCSNSCSSPCSAGNLSGLDGKTGNTGGVGADGAPGAPTTTTTGEYARSGPALTFRGTQASTGDPGAAGGGGGGGGAGGDVYLCLATCCGATPELPGGAGAAGGAGGCPGEGGTGGWQGGAAVGIEIIDTTISLQDVTIGGGQGGEGGLGGLGGSGASGEPGATATAVTPTSCASGSPGGTFTGGRGGGGGPGGVGGDGGRGGGGNGGIWMGLVLVNEADVASVLGSPTVNVGPGGSGGDGGQAGRTGAASTQITYDVAP